MEAPTSTAPVPLTTVWSSSKGCPSIIDFPSTPGCQPPAFSEVWFGLYYSPGICMAGYTIGCLPKGTTANGLPILSGETVGFCVPSGYQCSPDYHSITTGTGKGVARWDHLAKTTLDTPSISGSVTITTLTAMAFQVRWKSSDISILETPPVLPVTPSSSGTSISAPSSPTKSPPSSTTNGPRLSTGAIAGIAVGAVCIILLAATMVIILFRRRRREARELRDRNSGHDEGGTPELDGSNLIGTHAPMPSVLMVHEKGLEQDPRVVREMDGVSPVNATTAAGMGNAWGLMERHELMSQSIPTVPVPSELPAVGTNISTNQSTGNLTAQESQTFSPAWDPNSGVSHPSEPMTAQAGPIYMYPQEVPAAEPENTTSLGGNIGDSPLNAAGASTQDVAELLQRQARIQERRQRLMELDRLDREEEELQRRIRESQR